MVTSMDILTGVDKVTGLWHGDTRFPFCGLWNVGRN